MLKSKSSIAKELRVQNHFSGNNKNNSETPSVGMNAKICLGVFNFKTDNQLLKPRLEKRNQRYVGTVTNSQMDLLDEISHSDILAISPNLDTPAGLSRRQTCT